MFSIDVVYSYRGGTKGLPAVQELGFSSDSRGTPISGSWFSAPVEQSTPGNSDLFFFLDSLVHNFWAIDVLRRHVLEKIGF